MEGKEEKNEPVEALVSVRAEGTNERTKKRQT